jgi:hypothetical protein
MPVRKAHVLPNVGDSFNRTWKDVKYTMKIVSVGKGIGYKLGKNIYQTPSAAAKSVTQQAVNGWRFWHIE